MGGEQPKQYRKLLGECILTHTLRNLLNSNLFSALMTVIHPDDRKLYNDAIAPLEQDSLLQSCHGGNSRQASVRNGLRSLQNNSSVTSGRVPVLIHDAARPFVSHETLAQLITEAEKDNCVIAAAPVFDTIKRTNERGEIQETLNREELWRAQTPQAFALDTILNAHEQLQDRDNLTDDAAVAEAAGLSVGIVPSSGNNIKITTPEDLALAEYILQRQQTSQEKKS